VEALGYEDGGLAPAEDAFAALARIARAVDVPVTADIEDGYGLEPGPLADALLRAGAVGCNLEDSDHAGGGLVPADEQAARIAALKAAARTRGVDLVVNARTDSFLLGRADALEESLRRAALYLQAGADCIYPISCPRETIARLVGDIAGPVNVLARVDEPALDELAALGVARISFGAGLARATSAALDGILARLR
jgi:2-methylisocitrate lyase-like PEP mutase family enzyme